MSNRGSTILFWGLGISAMAVGVFLMVAESVVDLSELANDQVAARFDGIGSRFDDRPPMISMNDAGEITRRGVSTDSVGTKLERLGVLAYRASEEKLAEADIPFWFVRMKSPALQFVLRGTQVNLRELGVRASDLQQNGPGLVLDQQKENGDRLLIWVE